ncbi:conserved hypothetical protein [Neospora caninum Liverpool]|uniref:EF-hand domain-containing protein n=1 Tax=Neospora caninum (strain Liverpool) TaxID=572307 RepID=F0VD55_NEOCL|nr:conserved hypothetical protein [Neospora caninum Liverpool]CBZ51570.1 conserved hypothetical protein [Neospora caninum Liverpool]CEL65520.1 TPA: hypothetical protein BN1204_013630 [Neospora caninum Liverpool]|eukprot:XP_003881603.1 conserved hypothetical protein [Neospora caninum Liverpool]
MWESRTPLRLAGRVAGSEAVAVFPRVTKEKPRVGKRALVSLCSVVLALSCARLPVTLGAEVESSNGLATSGKSPSDSLSTTDAYFASYEPSSGEQDEEPTHRLFVDPAFWEVERYLKLAESVFGVFDREFDEMLKAAWKKQSGDKDQTLSREELDALFSELKAQFKEAVVEDQAEETAGGGAGGETAVGEDTNGARRAEENQQGGSRHLRRRVSEELGTTKRRGAMWLFDSANLEEVNLISMFLVALSVALEKIPIPDLSFFDMFF